MREEFQNKEKGQRMAPVWDLSKWQKVLTALRWGKLPKRTDLSGKIRNSALDMLGWRCLLDMQKEMARRRTCKSGVLLFIFVFCQTSRHVGS